MVDEEAQTDPRDGSAGDSRGTSRRELVRRAAFLLLAAVGAALVVLGLYAERSVSPVAPGRSLPSRAVPRLDAAPLALDTLRGRVVVLEFWATWCAPCVESLPALDRLAAERRDDGVVALAVNTDAPEGREERVRLFLQEHRISSLIPLIDDGSLARTFGVSALPTLLVVGRDGNVRASRLGAIEHHELVALVDEALADVSATR